MSPLTVLPTAPRRCCWRAGRVWWCSFSLPPAGSKKCHHPLCPAAMPTSLDAFAGLLLESSSCINRLREKIFSYRECFLNWGLLRWLGSLLLFFLSFILGVRQGIGDFSHFTITTAPALHSAHFPGIQPLRVLIRLCHKERPRLMAVCTLWALQNTEISAFRSCSSPSPASEVSGAVDTHTSFSNLSPSNFLPWASASGRASVFSDLPAVEASPLWQPCTCFLYPSTLRTVPQTSALDQLVFSRTSVHKHPTQDHSHSPIWKSTANPEFPPKKLFPSTQFLGLLASLPTVS